MRWPTGHHRSGEAVPRFDRCRRASNLYRESISQFRGDRQSAREATARKTGAGGLVGRAENACILARSEDHAERTPRLHEGI
jgi:hypothetical protein